MLKNIALYGAPFRGMNQFIRGLKKVTGARVFWLDSGELIPFLDLYDAVVFLHDEGRDQLPAVISSGKPVLSRSIPQLELGVPVIHMDDEGPARLIAEEMIRQGANSLFYWGMNLPFSRRRASGTLTAAQAAGVPFEETSSIEATIAAVLKSKKPAGLICLNDAWAAQAASALQQEGICMPEEVMLAGYDNDPLPETPGCPLLTTVVLPMFEQGELAGNLLSAADRGQKIELKIHTTSAPKIIFRNSTQRYKK